MGEYEVIIPVRNGGRALANSIESVLTGPDADDLLLTISDNWSTDGSPWKETLARFAPERWRVIAPPESLGRVEHWSWAFGQGRATWLKPLMSGDRIEPAFWKWSAAAIAQFPEAGMISCGGFTIDPTKAHPETADAFPDGGPAGNIYDHPAFVRDAIRGVNRPGALTQVLIRADVLKRALPFDPRFPWTADWRFYERCLEQAPAVQTPRRLVCQDRSIARLSTSWKGLRGSFGEEWRFAAEQAQRAGVWRLKGLLIRLRALGFALLVKGGRVVLPRRLRSLLTSVTGWKQSGSSLENSQ